MFTGIVEATSAIRENSGGKLTLERPSSFTDLKEGSSISVAGVCLSVVGLDDQSMTFDLTSETLKRTKLGRLKKGDRVNLERALRVGDRLEGHIVQGHVDGVGEVSRVMLRRPKAVSKQTQAKPAKGGTLTIAYPKALRGLIVPKGSVAVDGVSLTVATIDDETFSIATIPQTLKRTTLGSLKEGDVVNLETDIVGKYARLPSGGLG